MKLLKFYTDTCCQCKLQSEMLEHLDRDVEIVPVDCMVEEDLVLDYHIRTLPTLVLLDDEGDFLNKLVGITNVEIIRSLIDNARIQSSDIQHQSEEN